jgi:O-antigen/teichoic acid export membrane protein
MTKYLKGVVLTYSTKIIVLLLLFAINVIIVRTLGASGRGIIALLQTFFQIAVLVTMFGMSEGNTYYLGNRAYKHKDILSNVLFHTLITSLIFIPLAVFFREWLIIHFLKNIDETYFLIALCLFPGFFLFQHSSSMLLGHKHFVPFNIVAISRYVLFLLFLIILMPAYRVQGALWAAIIGIVSANIIAFSCLFKRGAPILRINFSFLKKSFVYGIKSQIGLILSQINRRVDIFIINLFLDPTHVGYYTIAVVTAEFPWYISQAAATALFPEASGMKREHAYRFTAFVCRNVIFIVLCLSVVLLILGRFLITAIFGADFTTSVMPFQLLLPGIVALSTNKVLCAGFSGTGKPEFGTYTAAVAAITTVTLNFLLIPLLGISGAAIASTGAYFAAAITSTMLFRNMTNLPFNAFLLIKREDIRKYPAFLRAVRRKLQNSRQSR